MRKGQRLTLTQLTARSKPLRAFWRDCQPHVNDPLLAKAAESARSITARLRRSVGRTLP